MNKCIVFLYVFKLRLYSGIFLFIFISTTYIIKFSIYLCSDLIRLLGLSFASLIWIIT
jgi:hypothetical protein